MTAPQFSVIMPTRNRPDYLREAIQSVLDQTIQDFEIVVVDDCSDVPFEVPADPRIRVIRNDHRRGPAGAFNRGVAVAQGENLTFLADDDWYEPRRLELALEGLRHAPVALCFARYADERPITRGRRVLRGHIGDKVMNRGWSFGMHAMAMRRDAWIGLDESYPASEDVEFVFRLTQRYPVWTVPEFGYLVRRHDEVRTHHGTQARIDGIQRVMDENRDWFDHHRRAKAFRTRRIGLHHRGAGQHRQAIDAFATSFRIAPSIRTAKDLMSSLLAYGRAGTRR